MNGWLRNGIDGLSLRATVWLYMFGIIALAPIALITSLIFGTETAFKITPLLVMVLVGVEYSIYYGLINMKRIQKGPDWFSDWKFQKSRFCGPFPPPLNQWVCVEVAYKDGCVAVRNSADPSKTTVVFTKEEWNAFVKGVKAGEFDF